MKFNWGTGILIVLVLFLLASAAFIIFALRQDVNLVHKDYYEKGVDYTEQMNITSRSAPFLNSIKIIQHEELLQIEFEEALAARIDSGKVLMYRPSNSNQDVIYPMLFTESNLAIPKENLISGRYIIKMYWYSGGLKYEIDKTVNIE